MNKLLIIFFLALLFCVDASAYKDMSDVAARADELNMNVEDYAFAMAMSGAFTGSMFGLFLWKSR